MFVNVYANPFIGERIIHIIKWEVRRIDTRFSRGKA